RQDIDQVAPLEDQQCLAYRAAAHFQLAGNAQFLDAVARQHFPTNNLVGKMCGDLLRQTFLCLEAHTLTAPDRQHRPCWRCRTIIFSLSDYSTAEGVLSITESQQVWQLRSMGKQAGSGPGLPTESVDNFGDSLVEMTDSAHGKPFPAIRRKNSHYKK